MCKAKRESRVAGAAGLSQGQSGAQGVARAFRPLPDDHPVYTVLGRITVEAAELEHILDQIIWDMAEGEAADVARKTAQMIGPAKRWDEIVSLIEERGLPAPLGETAAELKERTIKAARKRNRAIHDAWRVDLPSGEIAQFRSPREENKFGINNIDLADLNSSLIELRECKEATIKLWADLQAAKV